MGYVSYDNMITPNNGISVQFNLVDENIFFKTSVTQKWYPDDEFVFSPAQFHFHHGLAHKHKSNCGSEHTLNGKHYDLEMHIVTLNKNPENNKKLIAAVTGIIF